MKRNATFKVLLMFIVGLFLSVNTFAQQIVVKGIVKDTTGEPIIGANVIVKGTTNGTITDFDGNFLLNANKGDSQNHCCKKQIKLLLSLFLYIASVKSFL